MPGRAFIDTNVLVYAFSEGEPGKASAARAVLESCEPVVSTQVLSEFAHVVTRKLRQPADAVADAVRQIASSCDVLMIDPPIIVRALALMKRYRLGFFDSQIIAAALAGRATTLFSEDLQHGQMIDGELKIKSPFARVARQPRATYQARLTPATKPRSKSRLR